MKNRKTEHIDEKSLDKLWNVFMSLIYVSLTLVFILLGYLFLQKDIHKYMNRKVYSEAELLEIKEKAKARQRTMRAEKDWDKVVDGIHIRTGLRDDENLPVVIAQCTACHSAQLITQNRATKEGWKNMIKWMQETQGLGNLGKSEPQIINYLAKYYTPVETGRRKNLDLEGIEWYELE